MINNSKEEIIKEEDIIATYNKLGISTNSALDINQLARDYKEAIAMIQKEDYCTYAFIGNKS